MEMTYSIIQCITNCYDKVFDCGDVDANERLLFTDENTTAKNWKVKIIESNKEFPFDDIFKIRWNPFDYTNNSLHTLHSLHVQSLVSPSKPAHTKRAYRNHLLQPA